MTDYGSWDLIAFRGQLKKCYARISGWKRELIERSESFSVTTKFSVRSLK
jgi:hypothetical protein